MPLQAEDSGAGALSCHDQLVIPVINAELLGNGKCCHNCPIAESPPFEVLLWGPKGWDLEIIMIS